MRSHGPCVMQQSHCGGRVQFLISCAHGGSWPPPARPSGGVARDRLIQEQREWGAPTGVMCRGKYTKVARRAAGPVRRCAQREIIQRESLPRPQAKWANCVALANDKSIGKGRVYRTHCAPPTATKWCAPQQKITAVQGVPVPCHGVLLHEGTSQTYM